MEAPAEPEEPVAAEQEPVSEPMAERVETVARLQEAVHRYRLETIIIIMELPEMAEVQEEVLRLAEPCMCKALLH